MGILAWESILQKSGYPQEEWEQIVKRIERFDQCEFESAKDIFSNYPILLSVFKINSLLEVNRLLEKSSDNDFFDMQERATLIVADRLYGLGLGLAYYLKNFTNLQVLGVGYDAESISRLSQNTSVDLIIFVGMQENDQNYSVAESAGKKGCRNAIMWAGLDSAIFSICHTQHIKYMFDRYNPLEEFAQYVQLQIGRITFEQSLIAQNHWGHQFISKLRDFFHWE